MAETVQNFGLSVEQRQEQTITPQQMQSLAILASPIMELQQTVNQALQTNPVLEEADPETAPEPEESSYEAPDSELGQEKDDLEDQLDRIVELAASGAVGEDDHYFDAPSTPDDAERRDFMFDSIPNGVSMQENLLEQLKLSGAKGRLYELGEAVIGGIDSSGYLRIHPADLAMSEKCSMEEIEKALHLVQTFDPPGIGARNLSECLLLQLKPDVPDHDLLEKLIRDHLEDIAGNHLPQLAKELNITLDRLNRLIVEIRKLHPVPGDAFSDKMPQFVEPEAEIVPDGDSWKVISNDEKLPHIRISQTYLKMLEDPAVSKETRNYIREHLTGGKSLIRALEQRQSTIRRITNIIVSEQYDFFREGVSALKPMTMQQVADKLGCHETTVSRAISGKYLRTPKGLVEYKFFFTAGFRAENGETVSSRSIKETIRDMIDGEDPLSPLSDNTLMEMLNKRGLQVKRRTVAKYREELGIPSSHLRKVHQ